MSTFGILVICFVAVSFIGITVERLCINYGVFESMKKCYNDKNNRMREYTKKHNYDIRANKIIDNYRHKFSITLSATERNKLLCNMLRDILTPYRHLMTRNESVKYWSDDSNALEKMINETVALSSRYKGHFGI